MHDEAFRYFGGVTEECVYDQTKLVVLHEQYRELTLNQRFAQYATTANFRIRACEGFDPESKGKVEAGVKYVKQDCLYGEVFSSEAQLREHVLHWLNNVANVREHSTTKQQPQSHYDRLERSHMSHYQPTLGVFNNEPLATRKVDKTGLISWLSNKYSVPMVWQQNRVGVSESSGVLFIHDLTTAEVIAEHKLSLEKGTIVKNRDHYRNKSQAIATLELQLQQRLGEAAGVAIAALLKTTMPSYYKDQLRGVLDVLSRYDDVPEALLQHLIERDTLSATQLRDHIDAWTRAESRGRLPSIDNEPISTPVDLSMYQYVSQPTLQRGLL